MKPIGLMVISKESWSDTRRARKQWLPFYMAQRPEVERIIHVDRHRAWWRSDTATPALREGIIEVRQESLLLPLERSPAVRALNRRIIARRLKPLLDPSLRWVVLYYHPYDVDLVKGLGDRAFTVFDWTEDWAVFHRDDEMDALQREAVMSADQVWTVTESLRQQSIAWGKSADAVHTLINATTFPPATGEIAPSALVPAEGAAKIGFVGHAGPWFDAGLVAGLAASHPDWQWYLAGGVSEEVRARLQGFDSVHLLGMQAPEALMPMMCACDVLIAPYVPEFSGDATKLYDYLAAGKPVISAPCETAEGLQPLVTVCDGEQAWAHAISEALGGGSDAGREARLQEAARHHWNARVDSVLGWLDCEWGDRG